MRSKLSEIYSIHLELSREKPFKFKKIEANEQLEIAWNLIQTTVYTFIKSDEIAERVGGEERRVRKTMSILKALKYASTPLLTLR